jgi:hypothetical protein
MTNEEITKKNLDLLGEFMKYAFENPKILEKIDDAELVILPEGDSVLSEENLKIARQRKKEGRKVVVFKMKLPKPIIPQLEEIAV